MQHPELPTVAFIAAILVLVPSIWHWRAGNVAIVSLIAWLFAVNVIYGVNSIVWAGNVKNPSPVWCDISTKIVVGVSFALPICTTCICKHLEAVSSNRKVSYDASDKRRRMIFEGIMCIGLPLIFMALHYIVQGHRYDIFENIGCMATVYISVQAVLIIWFPQLLFSVITLIYAALALHHFIRRRLTFAAHLQQSNSALTTNRYLRLIAMAVLEMCWGTSLTAFNLYSNVHGGLRPWISWADVHSNFSRVGVFPVAFLPPVFVRSQLLLWWALPASSFIFFVFFGFGEEATKEYRKMWTWFRVKALRKKPAQPKASSLIASLPSFVGRPSNTTPVHVELKTTKVHGMDKVEPVTPTSTLAPSTPNTGKEAILCHNDEDSCTINTLSYYDHSTDAAGSPREEAMPMPTGLPSPPGYHRPFSPPSVYPTAAPRSSTSHERDGVIVTIHREASVDHIV